MLHELHKSWSSEGGFRRAENDLCLALAYHSLEWRKGALGQKPDYGIVDTLRELAMKAGWSIYGRRCAFGRYLHLDMHAGGHMRLVY